MFESGTNQFVFLNGQNVKICSFLAADNFNSMCYFYSIFCLVVRSAVVLPAVTVVSSEKNTVPDVFIEYGLTPASLTNPRFSAAWFQADFGEFLLTIQGVARYYIQNGCRITITPEEGADEDEIILFLMGSAIGALLNQRNVLVLHAGAIVVNGRGTIFLGPSGIGKSTLTAGLHKRGYSFLADDVCAITLINGIPTVIPGFPRLKLWTDVMNRLNTDRKDLKCIRGSQGLEKYLLPVEHAQDAPVPLGMVYGIEAAEVEAIQILPLKGAEKINLLLANTYRFEFLQGQGRTAFHFQQCADIGTKIAVYRIIRPFNTFLLEELMNLLEENFQK
ncbi:MAG: hypothetical protein OEL83_21080 [Desulforhopalus sp.]|nr:hypothetical protein [Desulforhopalus sp.]